MTLPTGAISLSQVNVELGRAANAPISLLETAVRNLAGIPSGPVDMYSLRGKSAYTPMQATGVNSILANQPTSGGAGTVSAHPSVNVQFGSGGYTFQWSFNPPATGPSLSAATSQTCTVSQSYAANANGAFDVTLQCVIQDNTGHSITVTGVRASATWGTAA